ncbi:MAG TPA: carboxypeptidase-like regulatory domain-containing protein, partial [Solirubrobacteraceae bacterium]
MSWLRLVVMMVCTVLFVPAVALGETTPVAPKPVNTEAPKLTGMPAVGQTLSCSAGGWVNSPTGYTYTWVRNGSPIMGQTGSSYVVQRPDYGHSISCQVTASNSGGEYTIVGLPTSLYKVTFHAEFEVGNYMTQYFNGESYRGEANRVSVAAGSVRSGINATMVAGGEITGRVTNAVTHVGVAGAGACAETEGHQESCAVTNAGGEYTITGLPSGSYSIWFHANSGNGRPGPGWSEYYGGKPSSNEASLVSVAAGRVTAGIDAETPDGQLAGRVTSAAGGSAIEGVEVCARLMRSGVLAPFVGCALTSSGGEYEISGLLSGSYEVEFVSRPEVGSYLTQYYNGKSSSATAEDVSVTSGSVTVGIDATMQAAG